VTGEGSVLLVAGGEHLKGAEKEGTGLDLLRERTGGQFLGGGGKEHAWSLEGAKESGKKFY